MSDELTRIFGKVKREFSHFADSYANAVKSAGDVSGKQFTETLDNKNMPADIFIEKLLSAFKSGLHSACEQMVKSGKDYVGQMKDKEKEHNH